MARLEDNYLKGLDLIKFNINKSIKLIEHFKSLSLHEKLDVVQQFSVNELIDKIVKSHKATLSEHAIKITIDINDSLNMHSYKSSFTEVLEQLIENSYLHGFETTKEPVIKIVVREAQENICLTYSDNGCGIPTGDHEKIFEPFYTTQRSSGCIGLGLPIIYNHLTQKLNGTLSWEKSNHQGVKILIYFPKNLNGK